MVDFTDVSTQHAWIKDQPDDLLLTIAARAALRVLPLIVDTTPRFLSGDALRIFRATAISWSAARSPPIGISLSHYARRSADASFKTSANAAAAAVASAAAHAALIVVLAASRHSLNGEAAKEAEAALAAASTAVAHFGIVDSGARAHLLAASAADATFIESRGIDDGHLPAFDLANKPLWWGETPAWAAEAWRALKGVLLDAEEHWEVWIDWYEDRLTGNKRADTISYVLLDSGKGLTAEQLLAQGPRIVNAEITNRVHRATASEETPPEPIPPQGAGPHFALGPAAKISIVPASDLDHVTGNNIVRIRQLLPLVRRAVEDLAGLLNPNAFPKLVRDVAEYQATIAVDEDRIPWGLVFGVGIMLENAADAARRHIADRNLPSLEDSAQAALESVLTLHGPLLLATAEGRELMEQADTLRLTREEQAALRVGAQIFAEKLQQDTNIIEPEAAKIVADAADVIGEGRHPERGTVFGRATIKHLAAVLVGAGTLAAFIPTGTALLGAATAGGVAWVGYESLKKSKRFSSAMSALGAEYDRLLDLGETMVTQRLLALAPFRQFVCANEEPLRQIASNSRQWHWMITYIDFIVQSSEFEHSDSPVQKS